MNIRTVKRKKARTLRKDIGKLRKIEAQMVASGFDVPFGVRRMKLWARILCFLTVCVIGAIIGLVTMHILSSYFG